MKHEKDNLLDIERNFRKNNKRNFKKMFKIKLTDYQP